MHSRIDPRQYFEEILTIVVRTYLHLGCANGCNEGIRTTQADFLRIKVKNLLAQMNVISPRQLYLTLKKYMDEDTSKQNQQPCQSVLDCIHAMTMFCQVDLGQKFFKNLFKKNFF